MAKERMNKLGDQSNKAKNLIFSFWLLLQWYLLASKTYKPKTKRYVLAQHSLKFCP